jgi:hypothetical protein
VTVTKKSRPTPSLQFTPSSPLQTYRNLDLQITGVAVFSECPVATSDLVFTWMQTTGLSMPSSILNTTLPDIFIPANTLTAGSIYTLTLTVFMGTDVSLSSTATYVLQTGYTPLSALINGGATSLVQSDTSSLKLSASASSDPDIDPLPNPQVAPIRVPCCMRPSRAKPT